jgi:hypothetical protein
VSSTATEAPRINVTSAGRAYETPRIVNGTTPRRRSLTFDQRVAIRRSLRRLAEWETNRVERIATVGVEAVAAYDIGVRQAVRDALAKLAGATYGDCETCHDPIPIDRLKAVPYARRCVRCHQRMEDGWDQPRALVGSVVRMLVGEPQGSSEMRSS